MVVTGCMAEKGFQLGHRDKVEEMDGGGKAIVALLITCDPLPLGDSVMGRGKFPSFGVMHRGSP